jgi:hypothetical protein
VIVADRRAGSKSWLTGSVPWERAPGVRATGERVFARASGRVGADRLAGLVGVRPDSLALIRVLEEARAIETLSLAKDRATRRGGGKRQVTRIQPGHHPTTAALFSDGPQWTPPCSSAKPGRQQDELRALERICFAVGAEVVLAGSRPCEPCATMDAALGQGDSARCAGTMGSQPARCAGGVLRVGDPVRVLR